jgi:type I restriction enzyme, R subunit
MTALLKDDAELFKQFMDNESFKRWLTDRVFDLTYDRPNASQEGT